MTIYPLRITVATGNAHKVREMEAWFREHQVPVELLAATNLGDVEETGVTFLENARIKAQSATPEDGTTLVIAEDSGFSIPQLSGTEGWDLFPGVYSNRWLTPERRATLLGGDAETPVTSEDKNRAIVTLMEGHGDRRAFYHCAMVLYDIHQGFLFETQGEMPLWLMETYAPQGHGGFGYDPIVYPLIAGTPDRRTVAELSEAEKNALSHRGKALANMSQFLVQGCMR